MSGVSTTVYHKLEVYMKKKYAQSKKDRAHESEGMERHFRSGMRDASKGSFVTGNDPSVGRGDYANLPQEKVMREYPRAPTLKGGYLDDSVTGIDEINSYGEGRAAKYRSYQK